jgi:hypothetical protein
MSLKITITPVKNTDSIKTNYDLTVEADSTSVGAWTRHGRFPTADDAVGSFSPPLEPSLKAHVLELLSRDESTTFNLEMPLTDREPE